MSDRKFGKSLPETGYKNKYVTIYRAALIKSFRPNDYVTLSLKWATGHAEHTAAYEEEPCHVLSAMVLASDVYEAYNPGEYFYGGNEIQGKVVKTVTAALSHIGKKLQKLAVTRQKN